MRKFFTCLLLGLLLSNNSLFAQEEDCAFSPDPLCEEGPDAPIDSGVGLLIGAAAFYTLKRFRDKKTNLNNTPPGIV